MIWLTLATSAMTILSMQLVSRKRWEGWLVGLANQALWVAVIVTTAAWGLLLLTVVLIWTYTTALVTWRRDDRRGITGIQR